MDRFGFWLELRTLISEAISGVQNAGSSLFWDDSRPNWLSRSTLRHLYATAKAGAEGCGVHVAVRHSDCGAPTHVDHYVMEPIGGRPLAFADERFEWRHPLYQGETTRCCPCSRDEREAAHWVIYDVLFETWADQDVCEALGRVLSDLFEAMECAGDRKPRSGIREHLLRALITVNDQILPQRIDDYIAERIGGLESSPQDEIE